MPLPTVVSAGEKLGKAVCRATGLCRERARGRQRAGVALTDAAPSVFIQLVSALTATLEGP